MFDNDSFFEENLRRRSTAVHKFQGFGEAEWETARGELQNQLQQFRSNAKEFFEEHQVMKEENI